MAKFKIDWNWSRANPYGVYAPLRGWFGRERWVLFEAFSSLQDAEDYVSKRIKDDLPRYYPTEAVAS